MSIERTYRRKAHCELVVKDDVGVVCGEAGAGL